MGGSLFQVNAGVIRQVVILQLLFLLLLSAFRLLFFVYFSPGYDTLPLEALADAFVLGLRIDLVLVSYLGALPLLLILANQLSGNRIRTAYLLGTLRAYFIVVYLLCAAVIGADFGFYSYFGEHTTIMIFGFFDDDTEALIKIGLKNYNLPLILLGIALFGAAVVWTVRRVLSKTRPLSFSPHPLLQGGAYLLLLGLLFLGARGSFGLFPLLKDIPDVSADRFVNSLPLNGVFAFQKASEQYLRNKEGSYDLIKRAGYKGRIAQAFRDYLGRDDINTTDLAANLVRITPANPAAAAHPPHVVVVMVESFGAPILAYQSESFDILRRLKKHFDEDILFTDVLSGANGTIVSLEPLLLGLIARPQSIAYGQSGYLGVHFSQAAAALYRRNGYETSFVYGGDLSWRNVGSFFGRQGFDHVEGKSSIEQALEGVEEHDWGVYDKHAYDFVLRKLERATKPQFIFLLTTNNHPPYILSKSYDSKPLIFPETLEKHITGDRALARQRLQDYQYALDMAGRFMDRIKASPLKERTAVAITGDNNTIEGIMHYDNPLRESKQVPFYLYLPPALRSEPFERNVSASHKDIFPTLYNRTLSSAPYVAMGTDLYDQNALHCGFNDAGILVSSGGAFAFGKAENAAQKACERSYRAALAVTQYLADREAARRSVSADTAAE